MISWMIVVVVIDDNDMVVGLANRTSMMMRQTSEAFALVLNEEKERGEAFTLALYRSASISASEEEEEAGEAFTGVLCSNSRTIASSNGTMD